MQIKVPEVAKLLKVQDKTIYRWIKDRGLPAFKINGQYCLDRAVLLEWATHNDINVSIDIFKDFWTGDISLAEALKDGGIHYDVGGTGKESVLKAAVDLIPLNEKVDKSVLLSVLMARESIGSTGIGDGIAIPHVRNPIVLHVPKPLIMLCFLENSIEYEALDGKPVNTIFMMVCPSIDSHLKLLSRLAYALRQPEFAEVVAQRRKPDKIIARVAAIDLAIRNSSSRPKESE